MNLGIRVVFKIEFHYDFYSETMNLGIRVVFKIEFESYPVTMKLGIRGVF
jgi:hypothetical protein